jgi:hypothetical protein
MPPLRPIAAVTFVLALSPVGAALADPSEAREVREVRECMERNTPDTGSVQTVRFVTKDAGGDGDTSRANIYGKRIDGHLHTKVCWTEPPAMRGSQLLTIGSDHEPQHYLWTPELKRTKVLTTAGVGGSLFGTVFSAEDLAAWLGHNRPGDTRRLDDSEVEDRAVYVLRSAPTAEEQSAYETVDSFVDQQTCVPLVTDSYETGHRLRKKLTSSPADLLQQDGLWYAAEVLMRDVVDEKQTRVFVEDYAPDPDVPDRVFRHSNMGRKCR